MLVASATLSPWGPFEGVLKGFEDSRAARLAWALPWLTWDTGTASQPCSTVAAVKWESHVCVEPIWCVVMQTHGRGFVLQSGDRFTEGIYNRLPVPLLGILLNPNHSYCATQSSYLCLHRSRSLSYLTQTNPKKTPPHTHPTCVSLSPPSSSPSAASRSPRP